jgi:DHA2 family multidrug resistance protein-like MFS transporter
VFGIEVFVAQYLQMVLGYSPLKAGLWSLPAAAAFVVGSMLTPPLAARLRPPVAMLGGIAVAGAGIALLTAGSVIAGITVISLGFAPLFTLAADIAISSAPPERAGAASGISETSSELGGALGLAVLGAIGAAVYRNRTEGTLPAEAGDTLAGAVAAADRLPHILEPARDAYVQALQVAATVSGVLVLAAAAIVARLLRGDTERARASALLSGVG